MDTTPTPRSPQRVKVTGSLFKGVVPDGAVYVGRPAPGLPGSLYRNMFVVKKVTGGMFRVWDQRAKTWCGNAVATRQEAAAGAMFLFEAAAGPVGSYAFDPSVLHYDLAGKDLACWCDLVDATGRPVPCHGNVLLQRANRGGR